MFYKNKINKTTMKKYFILIFLLIFFVKCKQNTNIDNVKSNNSRKNILNKKYSYIDTVEFKSFLKFFSDTFPPIEIKRGTYDFPMFNKLKRIDTNFVKYVCNFSNSCFSIKLSGEVSYSYVVKLNTISKKYYAIIYLVYNERDKRKQYILATYSKPDCRLISKYTLFYDTYFYLIESKIDNYMNIKTLTSCNLDFLDYMKIDDKHFIVESDLSYYKINDYGTIMFKKKYETQSDTITEDKWLRK